MSLTIHPITAARFSARTLQQRPVSFSGTAPQFAALPAKKTGFLATLLLAAVTTFSPGKAPAQPASNGVSPAVVESLLNTGAADSDGEIDTFELAGAESRATGDTKALIGTLRYVADQNAEGYTLADLNALADSNGLITLENADNAAKILWAPKISTSTADLLKDLNRGSNRTGDGVLTLGELEGAGTALRNFVANTLGYPNGGTPEHQKRQELIDKAASALRGFPGRTLTINEANPADLSTDVGKLLKYGLAEGRFDKAIANFIPNVLGWHLTTGVDQTEYALKNTGLPADYIWNTLLNTNGLPANTAAINYTQAQTAYNAVLTEFGISSNPAEIANLPGPQRNIAEVFGKVANRLNPANQNCLNNLSLNDLNSMAGVANLGGQKSIVTLKELDTYVARMSAWMVY